MDASARTRIGPERARLGSMLQMPQGPVIVIMYVVAAIVLVGALVVVAVTAIRMAMSVGDRFGGGGVAAVLVIAIPLVLLVLVGLAVVGLAAAEFRRTNVCVHEEGLAVRQPWFTRFAIAWAEVAAIEPPIDTGQKQKFHLVLANGERRMVTRLNLRPESVRQTSVTHHADVEMVLEHYRQWCRRSGRTPNIVI